MWWHTCCWDLPCMKHIQQLACCHVQCLLLTPAGGWKRAKKGPEDHDLLQYFGQLQSCRQVFARAWPAQPELSWWCSPWWATSGYCHLCRGRQQWWWQSGCRQAIFKSASLGLHRSCCQVCPLFTVHLKLLSATVNIRELKVVSVTVDIWGFQCVERNSWNQRIWKSWWPKLACSYLCSYTTSIPDQQQ